MTTTAMNAVRASVARGSGPSHEPGRERHRGDDQHERHEDLADPVDQPLDRRLRALGPLDELDDRGQDRIAADARGPHHDAARRR